MTRKTGSSKGNRGRSRQSARGRPAAALKAESIGSRKARARRILARLRALYPQATCTLDHKDPFQLLVATILAAQATDEGVNRVTPTLFARYPTPADLAAAPPAEVEAIVRSTGFYRQKTRSIQAASRMLVEKFGGQVPATMPELLQLPGVARKTANVVLGTWFGRNEGIVVDTHVGRLAGRLGLTWTSRNDKDAVKIEQDLMQLVPRKDWTFFAHALVWHGRRVCTARKPDCAACAIKGLCPSAFAFEPAVAPQAPARRGTTASGPAKAGTSDRR